jgi:predicted DNA-binding transcriptional regulator YafY
VYHPTTRVLTVLELLQAHGHMSGPELAARLEVDVRSVRRYVTMLQELGIPVEGIRGRHGTYRLRPGYKLPPLMFNEDEALALVVGLLTVRGSTSSTAGAETALTKVERVMPLHLRERVAGVEAATVLSERHDGVWPVSGIVGELGEAVRHQQRVALCYRAEQRAETEREMDPFGLLYRYGRWYVAGYCHLRQELRTFRVDRIVEVRRRPQTFTRPGDFDVRAFVERTLALVPRTWSIEALLETTLGTARRRVPPVAGTVEPTANGVLFRGEAEDLSVAAHFLAGLGCRVRVRRPVELRDELQRLARHVADMALDDSDVPSKAPTEGKQIAHDEH